MLKGYKLLNISARGGPRVKLAQHLEEISVKDIIAYAGNENAESAKVIEMLEKEERFGGIALNCTRAG